MATWFRFYTDALNNPKVQRLPPHLFKTWVNLLCIASNNDGVLPSEDDLAYLLRLRVDGVRRDVAALSRRCLLDVAANGVTPHDWNSRQYTNDVSTQRVRDHRKRSIAVPRNVIGTSPDTETYTEHNREDKVVPLNGVKGLRSKPKYSSHFELVWNTYKPDRPLNSSKAEAWKSYERLDDLDQAKLCLGLEHYMSWLAEQRKKQSDFPAKHLSTFLNARSWEPFEEQNPEIYARIEAYHAEQGDDR